MKKYTRRELAKELQQLAGLTHREALALVTIMIERIRTAIIQGKVVEFKEFGVFTSFTKDVVANITTVPTRIKTKHISFRPSKRLKTLMKEVK
jgi:nucleoid DNA-binding protein